MPWLIFKIFKPEVFPEVMPITVTLNLPPSLNFPAGNMAEVSVANLPVHCCLAVMEAGSECLQGSSKNI